MSLAFDKFPDFPKLMIYRLEEDALEIIPGRPERTWMDGSVGRSAYRCLPMTIANCSGWEMVAPCSFEASWAGEAQRESLVIHNVEGYSKLDRFVSSHFGDGVLTFRTGHLLRTDPEWATWVRGAPNFIVDGIQPLDGFVETGWLPFTFTMNWIFTRPGRVRFSKGDPIAFVTLVPQGTLDGIQPTIANLEADPDFHADYSEWLRQREVFIQALTDNDPEVIKRGWQRHYTQGMMHDGRRAPPTHLTKRRLKEPR